jgi:hypothetical protein
MNTVIPAIDILSTSAVKLTMQYVQDNHTMDISIGTGFFWRGQPQTYLITNWHNVTGRHFETNEPLNTTHSAIPNQIMGQFFAVSLENKITLNKFNLALYDSTGNPKWIEHPVKTDVVAISLEKHEVLNSLTCANSIDSDLTVSIAENVFVLGYPKNISVEGIPIWKKASIASEPMVNVYKNKPSFLIDTATKDGMSGAPVYAIPSGPYKASDGNIKITLNGGGRKFVGIYSGRLGKNEFEAQLGIVWKKEVITEIIEAQK